MAFYGLQAMLSKRKDKDFQECLQWIINSVPLIQTVDMILFHEWIDAPSFIPEKHNPKKYSNLYPDDKLQHSRTCDICRCDIFNRAYHCPMCSMDLNADFDLCLDCIAEGNSCPHDMLLVEYMSMKYCNQVLSDAKAFFTVYVAHLKTEKQTEHKLPNVESILVAKNGKNSIATNAFLQMNKKYCN